MHPTASFELDASAFVENKDLSTTIAFNEGQTGDPTHTIIFLIYYGVQRSMLP